MIIEKKLSMCNHLMHVTPTHRSRTQVYEEHYRSQNTETSADLASCAAVSRAWQVAFEETTFRYITLKIDRHKVIMRLLQGTEDDIDLFQQAFHLHRRRRCLRTLYLRIGLLGDVELELDTDRPFLGRRRRRSSFDAKPRTEDQNVFSQSVQRLFHCLSAWLLDRNVHRSGDTNGITLELGIVILQRPFTEPSSSQPMAGPDQYSNHEYRLCGSEGQRLEHPARLPLVQCVRSFTLMRDCAYPISFIHLLLPVLQALTEVEEIR